LLTIVHGGGHQRILRSRHERIAAPDGSPTCELVEGGEAQARVFDLHLRGIRQPLLDGPTPANPEVAFHNETQVVTLDITPAFDAKGRVS
jgi:hypothetical protein